MKIRTTGFTIALSLAFLTTARAAEYFVSTTGSDTNPGTFASPFVTIQKAASLLIAGDTCSIRAGTYREKITPANSGTAGAPITFQPYSNEVVTVSGADAVSGWSIFSNMVYRAPMNWTLGDSNQVFLDGQMMNLARWPNSSYDISRPTKSIASNAGSETNARPDGWHYGWLADAALTNSPGFWDGALLQMMPGSEWVGATGIVISNDVGYLAYKWHNIHPADPAYTPNATTRYYLAGKLSLLDTFGEWFYDAGTQQLYLWTPTGDSPASHIVEAKRRSLAFDLVDRSYINVTGLRIFAANIVMNSACRNNTIDRLNAKYIFHSSTLNSNWQVFAETSGLVINGTSNALVNSEIAFAASSGVVVLGTNHVVTNCIIHEVDYLCGDGAGIYTGVNFSSASVGHELAYNTVYNSGMGGLFLRRLSAGKVHHNDGYTLNLQSSDVGGGIYTHGSDGGGTEIHHNTFHDICDRLNPGVGIYLDNLCHHFVIHHNSIWNCGEAITMNLWSHTNLVYNNTALALTAYSLAGFVSFPTNKEMNGCVIQNNVFNRSILTYTNAVVDHNLLPPTNALFTSEGALNFTLQADSPARDTGLNIAGITSNVTDGLPDLGAYEYGQPVWRAGASWVTLPAGPSTLSGNLSGGQVALNWTDNATNETEFVIDRSLDGRLWGQLVHLPADSTNYTDPAPPPGTVWYRVRANDSWYGNYIHVFNGHDPFQVNQAEDTEAASGVITNGSGISTVIASADAGDWLRYDNVDFRDGATAFSVFAISLTAGRHIEARLDATNGTLIADLVTIATGAGVFTNQATTASNATGVHTLYLVFKGGGNVCTLDTFIFTPAVTPASPVPSSSLSAASNGAASIQLTWSDNSSNETGFRLERSTDNQNFVEIAKLAAGLTNFTDTGLAPATTYYYRVRAANTVGLGNYGPTLITATSDVGTPVFQLLTTLVSGGFRMQFTGSPDLGYSLYASSDLSNWSNIATVSATNGVFTCDDPAASNAPARFYRLRWP